jgi:AcrR family transcriptional regulator
MTKIPPKVAAEPARPRAEAPLVAKPARNAGDTRARILAAARARFSRDAYENVGTREIAAEAGVDAALVNRYFGGKEKLFGEVVAGAFRVEDHLPDSLATLGQHLVDLVMNKPDRAGAGAGDGFDPLRLLLRASGSPATADVVSARFHAEFVQPLGKLLRGRDAELRAALIASYVIGLATMKHALGAPALGSGAQRRTAALVGAAIQACVAG